MNLERNGVTLKRGLARPRRRRAPYDVATLCTLDVGQVLAVAGMVTGEKPRITLRDILLLRLRDILRAEGFGGSAEEDAICIAADLVAAPFAGRYGDLLRAVADLSRDRKPPAAPHITKILRKIESTAAISAT